MGGRRIVLFAPTWRGDSFQDPQANAAQLVSAVRKLQKAGVSVLVDVDHSMAVMREESFRECSEQRFLFRHRSHR